jgi:hypothetical protein
MSIIDAVADDIRERAYRAMLRHGKIEDELDAEDLLQHAYENALDVAVRLRAEIERRRAKQ